MTGLERLDNFLDQMNDWLDSTLEAGKDLLEESEEASK